MKKLLLICFVFIVLFSACARDIIFESAKCSLCSGIPHHAPCIINLSTGELLELDIYEPHPTLVAEIAEEQRGGYFSLVHGAGIEGYKMGAESLVITIPIEGDKLVQKNFCNACRNLLAQHKKEGYALVDLKDAKNPTVFLIKEGLFLSLRCYEVSVDQIADEGKYKITIIGTHKST